MHRKKITETIWYPKNCLLVTQISGILETAAVEAWETSLRNALDQIGDNSSFKIFVNMHGFTAANFETHKRFRSVVPLTLADYNWKVGYVDLFEDAAKHMTYQRKRGITCAGAAHAHHDGTKMDLYETRFGREKEHFFHDPVQASTWIENLEISG